ncbi:MAG: hypothetical protein ACR2HQ_00500 [Ilumatobacteraceae bacterium]
MAHPLSVRFGSADVVRRVKREAEVQRRSASAVIEELVDEGLRVRRHPLITFRAGERVDGPCWSVDPTSGR